MKRRSESHKDPERAAKESDRQAKPNTHGVTRRTEKTVERRGGVGGFRRV
jgi:hypothetical protein